MFLFSYNYADCWCISSIDNIHDNLLFCDESYEVLIWKKQICCWFVFDWGNGSMFDKTKSWSWTVSNHGKQFEGTGDSSLTVWIFRPFKLHRPTMDHNLKLYSSQSLAVTSILTWKLFGIVVRTRPTIFYLAIYTDLLHIYYYSFFYIYYS